MQIQSLSRILPEHDALMFSRVEKHTSFYQSQKNITVQYSDEGDTVILSQLNTFLYMESTYTSEGILMNSEAPFSGETDVLDASPENEVSEANVVENAGNRFLKIIRARVEYLLRELSQQISGISPHQRTNTAKNEKVPMAYVNFTYYQSTISLSQTTIIARPNTDFSYFSAENTADRIIQFVLAFYTGGDREEYVAMVREAVMKGYYEAKKTLGGFLPYVSEQTIFLVNKALDDFAAVKDINISA